MNQTTSLTSWLRSLTSISNRTLNFPIRLFSSLSLSYQKEWHVWLITKARSHSWFLFVLRPPISNPSASFLDLTSRSHHLFSVTIAITIKVTFYFIWTSAITFIWSPPSFSRLTSIHSLEEALRMISVQYRWGEIPTSYKDLMSPDCNMLAICLPFWPHLVLSSPSLNVFMPHWPFWSFNITK